MAHPDLPSEHDNSQEDRKEKDSMQLGPTTLQRARACFLKGVSYFSGDMEVFGKWMESKSTLIVNSEKILSCPPQKQYGNGILEIA